MCQHTCSIYTEHVFIQIYICLVYNIGHVSLMCEDTCMHIAYTEHLFIMCEYTCLVRDTCPGLAPVFCPPIWPLAPPCWSPHKNCPRPSHRRAAAACRPADSCSLHTARGTLVVLTRGFGPSQSFINKGSPWFNADSVDIFYTATSFIISSRKTFPFKKRKPYDQ